MEINKSKHAAYNNTLNYQFIIISFMFICYMEINKSKHVIYNYTINYQLIFNSFM